MSQNLASLLSELNQEEAMELAQIQQQQGEGGGSQSGFFSGFGSAGSTLQMTPNMGSFNLGSDTHLFGGGGGSQNFVYVRTGSLSELFSPISTPPLPTSNSFAAVLEEKPEIAAPFVIHESKPEPKSGGRSDGDEDDGGEYNYAVATAPAKRKRANSKKSAASTPLISPAMSPNSKVKTSRRPTKRPRRDLDYELGDDSDDEELFKEKKPPATKPQPIVPESQEKPTSSTHLGSPAKLPRTTSKRVSLRELAMQESLVYPATVPSIIPPRSEDEEIVTNHVRDIVRGIDQVIDQLNGKIAKIAELQTHYIATRAAHLLSPLQQEHLRVMEEIDEAIDKLQMNSRSMAMEFEICNQVHIDLDRLHEQRVQVQLYAEELEHLLKSGAPRTVARLIIAQQPLRHVIFKEKSTEDTFVVKLLTGTNSFFDSVSTVTIQMYLDESGEHVLQDEKLRPLDYTPGRLEGNPRTATFDNIKLNLSSRMLLASLRFCVTLKLGRETQVVESDLSNQFIVITNESQFVDATHKLLMTELYGDAYGDDTLMSKILIKWPAFANLLQTHFISATSQRDTRATRDLQYYEMNYIQKKFANGEVNLSPHHVRRALDFVLNSERQIRFKRHVFHLWNAGILFGFFPRDKIEAVLEQQGVGTFIVRLSESQFGQFVVSFVVDDTVNRVQHYLVKADDIGSSRTLPDFLRDAEMLQYLLVFRYKTGEVIRRPKMEALAQWTQKKKNASVAGYLDSLF